MFIVSIGIFAITEALPSDVADIFMGKGATEGNLAMMREELGLNRPAPVRYLEWVGNAVRGDFGHSWYNKTEIAPLVARRLVHSAILAVFALVVAVPMAVMAGIWAGVRPDTKADRVVSLIGLIGISLPEFVTGVLLILLFSSTLDLLPSVSIILPDTTPLSRPQILIMPTLTITAVLFAYIMRMTRANVIEVMQTDYVRTAILKGLSMRQVIFQHVQIGRAHV
jgi:peptide/nickel transport system permease protein